jgi:hypothetical protein
VVEALEGQRKTLKSFGQDNRCLGRDLNWATSEYISETFRLSSVFLCCQATQCKNGLSAVSSCPFRSSVDASVGWFAVAL